MQSSIKVLSEADVPNGDYMGPEQRLFFKGLLEQRIAELTLRLEKAKELFASPEHYADEFDRAAFETERTLAFRMAERDRSSIIETRHAIARIDADAYGYCNVTGDEIGHGRLVLFPASIYSVEVMQRQERQKMHQRA